MNDRQFYRPRDGCRRCRADFASVAAFDRHRVGVHDLDFPEHEEGRRCKAEEEMLEAGLEQDEDGRWRRTLTEAERARLEAALT